jgi:hypothetical protein
VITPPKLGYLAKLRFALQRRRAEKAKLAPADRAALSTARATWAIAILTLVTIGVGVSQFVIFNRQLNVMSGQLDAMLRDEEPRIRILTELMRPPTFSLMKGSQDTGYAAWNVFFINAGKGSALKAKVNSYISLGDGPFIRSNAQVRADPFVTDEISPGGNGFFTIFSLPIPKADFDSSVSKDHAISIYFTYDYSDDREHTYNLEVCMTQQANGTLGFLHAAECKKKIMS